VAGGASVFELRLLGPVQAVRAGRDVPVGGPRQRAVLALLALEAGRVVLAGQLVEEVWGGRAPPGAAKTLRSYVSRLRSVLAPEVAVISRGGGYAVNVGPGQLDADRFERLVAEGQAALSGGEAAAAGNRFREALALWRGPALADVVDVARLASAGGRLEGLRLVAVEGRLAADLAAGLHAEVAGELERLVGEYPVRERLWQLLMLALYRGGRQADALAAYRRARAVLAGELGLEPGEELRELQRAVLRQDVQPVASRRQRHNLPARLTSFIGREREVAGLGKLLGEARLVTLTGVGGAGKTRLAIESAERVMERFPDGVWLTDLAGITDPGLVPSLLMEVLEVRQVGDMPVMEALRWRLRSAELLLVLDNCEHLLDASADLADVLLRGAPGLRVLATSREPLGRAGEVIYPVAPLAIPPEGSKEESVIARAPAARLFLERVWAARGGVSQEPGSAGAVAGICRELDGLPLAIELAAARASTLSVEEIEAHLSDRFQFLAYRRPVADPRHQALKAAIDWTYDLLPAAEQRVFRELSVFAADFGLEQVSAVCSGGDEAAALELVDRLASKSLVVAETAPGRTRYRLLETIRQYAADRLAEADGAEAARYRHAVAFLSLAEREHAIAVLSREHDNLRAALGWSLSGGSEIGPRLARALGSFWLACGFFREGQGWLERALALGPADQEVRADLLRLLGTLLYEVGDLPSAEATLSEGYEAAAAAGSGTVQARIRVLLSQFHFQRGRYSLEEAVEGCEAAVTMLESDGDPQGLAEAWLTIGQLRFFHGEGPASAEAIERAEGYARRSANRYVQQQVARWLVIPYTELSIPAVVAIGRAEQLLEAATGDPWAEVAIVAPLSVLYAFVGRFADARAAIARGQSTFIASGAKLSWAECAMMAGWIEMMAGNPAAAEEVLRKGCEVLRELGERGWLCGAVTVLARAVYAQGRLDEAQQLTQEAEAITDAGDISEQVRWRLTRAKVFARRGRFRAARQLTDEAQALAAPTSWPAMHAEVLIAQAEVSALAGAREEAADSLRTALRIYEERQASALAGQTKATLAVLLADRQ
jgi:predicted ATPase/DNA-binding SARP family transcriptional activator